VSDDQVARFLDRIRAERVARGRAPTIQTPSVYVLLAAVVAADRRTQDPETN
jgi:hypothetical protein